MALREEREQKFRSGVLPLLYCSPTMELGIDISDLNIVAMRNVPPTPANYAQRSGRAGRSGNQLWSSPIAHQIHLMTHIISETQCKW